MRRRTFVAGAALAVAGPRPAFAADNADQAGVLRAAVELEQLAAFVYSTRPREFEALAAHEQEHAEALASHLEALGSPRPKALRTAAEADARLERLGATGRLATAGSTQRFLELALELELRQVAAYTLAAGELEDVRLIQTTASILAAEGTHLVVIRAALGRAQVPNPLETGRP